MGAHGAEYMTGGTIVVLGPIGRNAGAGMTGGRLWLYDEDGRATTRLNRGSVAARPALEVRAGDDEGMAAVIELAELVADHAEIGSAVAAAHDRGVEPRSRVVPAGRTARSAPALGCPA